MYHDLFFFACLSLFKNNKKNQFTVLMMQETFITTTIMPLFKMSFNLFYLVLKENNYMKIKYLANPYVPATTQPPMFAKYLGKE